MFTISALSPPSTPRGAIFSPRQQGCGRWTGYALSLQSPGKRVKLEHHQTLPIKPTSTSRLQFPQASTLASRRMKKAPPMALAVAKEPEVGAQVVSTGLSPIVKGLTLGRAAGPGSAMMRSPLRIDSFGSRAKGNDDDDSTAAAGKGNPFPLRKTKKAKPSSMQLFKEAKTEAALPAAAPSADTTTSVTQPPPMTFRLQKTAPAKKKTGLGGNKMAKLGVAPTGLISPPTTTTPLNTQPMMRLGGGGRPPALALGIAANTAMMTEMSPLSPSMPQTPGTGGVSGILSDCSAYGEASPSFLARRTPSPVGWAPTFFVTPPTPPVPGTKIQAVGSGADTTNASASLAPVTPPWPKSGSSLRKTIFDHIGQPKLSPMDLRGYMAISMNS
ncbi:hypothetical protein EV175_001326 [Coemansia sp. RSA 1933]|nr:hypothetical protein EV175_001326 [Coemansia sp. RSA 1933]